MIVDEGVWGVTGMVEGSWRAFGRSKQASKQASKRGVEFVLLAGVYLNMVLLMMVRWGDEFETGSRSVSLASSFISLATRHTFQIVTSNRRWQTPFSWASVVFQHQSLNLRHVMYPSLYIYTVPQVVER